MDDFKVAFTVAKDRADAVAVNEKELANRWTAENGLHSKMSGSLWAH